MRYWKSILTIALMSTTSILAQPPGGPRGGRNGPGVSTEDLIQRILRYDKNKDGKVTKDELPDRMQHLLEMGDTNKDGALDKDEIKALAERLNKDTPRGPGGLGRQRGPGPGGPGFGPPGGPDGLERILEDLNLPEKTMDKADAVVRAHQRKMRKLMDQAREDLLKEMKPILSTEEFEKFKEALDRRPPPPPPPPPPGE